MRRSLLFFGAALALAGPLPLARAQGSGVMTHSACAVGLGGAGAGAPCDDGSAILFNPAALVFQPSVFSAGVTAIHTDGSFVYDREGGRVDRKASTSWVPFGFLNYNVNARLSAALGVFEPYGLHLAWPDSFEGRYESYDTRFSNVYLQPTVAYALSPRVSLGAGLDVVYSNISLRRRLDLSSVPLPSQPFAGRTATFGSLGIPVGTDFADLRMTAHGTGVTFHVAALGRLNDRLSIGVRYLHSAALDLKGNADFSPLVTGITLPRGNPLSVPGNPLGLAAGSAVSLDPILFNQFTTGNPLADQSVSTRLTLPSQLVVGLAFRPARALEFVGDYQWTRWESFDRADLSFGGSAPGTSLILDYRNTSTYRAGAEYQARGAFTVRTGFVFNTAAEGAFSVSPLLPEAERNYYAVGLGWNFRPRMRLDAGYQLVRQSDRRGRVRARSADMTEPQLEALNVGVYSASAHVLDATFSYRFGTDR
jgi:long-chain fatty acid transport protein